MYYRSYGIPTLVGIGRGAFHYGVEGVRTTYFGADGKANVGISNDKEDEKSSRRKTKVS